ncbi:glycosylphosphatidylinositol anchor biosynthesis [Spiromyces aspiralis]|uniref:Glycosylphosphatidylinositol anchor biosynthesis n=1 Tax=Spiromyces aspiralis TaxID=68401 RepID=A0ACC1HU71_9FUNG|nr:glycosylphosphatidylinositol anchor biosynthesis [Spiromyces aspiralis]
MPKRLVAKDQHPAAQPPPRPVSERHSQGAKGRGLGQRSRRKWRRLLYINQDEYPDSYVDETFLMELQKNVNVQIYDYWEVVMQSTAVSQHTSSIIVFIAVFIYLFRQELDAASLQWWNCLATMLGCVLWDCINVYLQTPERRVFRLRVIKGGVFFVLLLFGLTPVLRTLTLDTSDDTIWALSTLLFLINLAFHDYGSANLTNIGFPGSISLNAAVFAAVLLASRLRHDDAVFAFMVFALVWFGLFPISRRYLKGISAKATVLITAFLATLATCLFYPISKTVMVLQVFGTMFVSFVCPLWLIWVQRYKDVVKEISRINRNELKRTGGFNLDSSWHNQYKDSAYIFIGGLDYELTEGDVICVFSQYGEVVNINLVRDKETGKSKGFAFLQYEDQRSTVLAVDNLNGIKLLGRTLRVDHVLDYRHPDSSRRDGEDTEALTTGPVMNVAPQPIDDELASEGSDSDARLLRDAAINPEDPMAEYYLKKLRKKIQRSQDRERKKRKKHPRSSEARDTNAMGGAAEVERTEQRDTSSRKRRETDQDSDVQLRDARR